MKVGVIGAGAMGSGIAQTCALAGHEVVLVDVSDAALERGLTNVRTSLERMARKETISAADAAACLDLLNATTEMTGLADAGVVIEAVYESIDVKRDTWHKISAATSEGALLATNTSSLSVTEIASFSGRSVPTIRRWWRVVVFPPGLRLVAVPAGSPGRGGISAPTPGASSSSSGVR